MIVEEENDLGLLSGHAYAILDHQEVVGSTGKTERIIKIRNPWGFLFEIYEFFYGFKIGKKNGREDGLMIHQNGLRN